jgi:4-oxalocrotonate tautomerase
MPHVNLKLYKGRTEEQKKQLTKEFMKSLTSILEVDECYITVAIEDFEASDWPEAVYRPEIENQLEKLYKKPGYNPLK